MKANSRLRVICRTENPKRTGAFPEPDEAHRLMQAFWRIMDANARARLLRDAESAASREPE